MEVKFTASDTAHYDFLYEALSAVQSVKGLEARTLAKVLNKLESIGSYAEGSLLYKLNANGGTVSLEKQELDLIEKLLETVEFTANGARQYIRTLGWLIT